MLIGYEQRSTRILWDICQFIVRHMHYYCV